MRRRPERWVQPSLPWLQRSVRRMVRKQRTTERSACWMRRCRDHVRHESDRLVTPLLSVTAGKVGQVVLSNADIDRFFASTSTRIAGNPSLREPQSEGHAAAVDFFSTGGARAVEQIPVGCGKTGLIAILPFGIARGRVLAIAPNLTIRDQIARDVDASNPENFYRRAGVLTDL